MNLGIIDGFKYLASELTKHTDTKVTVGAMRKEDLEDLIRQNISMHSDLSKILSTGSSSDMVEWMQNKVRPAIQSSSSKVRDAYDNFLKAISGTAASDERKRPFGSFAEAHKDYAKILSEILKHIDEFMTKDKVTLYESHVSQMAILGLLRESNAVCKFNTYLYTYLTLAVSHSDTDIPKYREQFILDNLDFVAKAITKIRNHAGTYVILNDLASMKRNNGDFILGATGKFNFDQFAVRRFYTPNVIDTILGALSCLNIFDAIGNAINDYKIDRNNRNKETKQWLENHVALLRLDLADKDQSSPEYTKLLNIIKAYDEKITEYDEKINAFENGD